MAFAAGPGQAGNRAGTGHSPLCWWHKATDELQLLRCNVANLPRYWQAKICLSSSMAYTIIIIFTISPHSLRATVRWIINIICVGQKSVPWMDGWSSLFCPLLETICIQLLTFIPWASFISSERCISAEHKYKILPRRTMCVVQYKRASFGKRFMYIQAIFGWLWIGIYIIYIYEYI